MGKTLKYVKEFDFGPQKTYVDGYCRGGPMKKAAGGAVAKPAPAAPPAPPAGARPSMADMKAAAGVHNGAAQRMAASNQARSNQRQLETQQANFARSSQEAMRREAAAKQSTDQAQAAQLAQKKAQNQISVSAQAAAPSQQTDADRSAITARGGVNLKKGGKVSAAKPSRAQAPVGSCKW